MEDSEYKTIEQLLAAYKAGQRKFDNWDFREDGSTRGMNLTGIEFTNCFLYLDFRDSNLSNSKFIGCNIKTADFRGANLKNALITNCSVESTMFKGANIENFRFEDNYSYGATVGPDDFEELFRNE